MLHKGPAAKWGPSVSEYSSSSPLSALLSEMLGFSGPRSSHSNAIGLALPSVSAHTAQCHRALSIFVSRAEGKSSPPCLQPSSAKENSVPATPFQCSLVNHPPPPSLPPEPTLRGSQPHSATYCMVAGWLHPVEPQASLPDGCLVSTPIVDRRTEHSRIQPASWLARQRHQWTLYSCPLVADPVSTAGTQL